MARLKKSDAIPMASVPADLVRDMFVERVMELIGPLNAAASSTPDPAAVRVELRQSLDTQIPLDFVRAQDQVNLHFDLWAFAKRVAARPLGIAFGPDLFDLIAHAFPITTGEPRAAQVAAGVLLSEMPEAPPEALDTPVPALPDMPPEGMKVAFLVETSTKPSAVSIRVSKLPLTISLKWPKPRGQAYEMEMVSLTQVELEPANMVFELELRDGEAPFEGYLRAMRSLSVRLLELSYDLRFDAHVLLQQRDAAARSAYTSTDASEL